jgi:hypothetical protein
VSHLDLAFSVLLDDTLRRCDRIAADLEELRALYGGGVAGRSYRTFIEALQLVNETTRSFLQDRRTAFASASAEDPVDPAAAARLRESTYDLVRNTADAMATRLEGQVQLLRLPRSEDLEVFAAPMTRLTKLIVTNAEVLFFPWTAFEGYRLETYDADYAKKLEPMSVGRNLRRVYGNNIAFLKLRHPSPRRDDLFQHTVFAHEIAHAAIGQPLPPDPGAPAAAPGQRPLTYLTGPAGMAPTGLPETTKKLVAWLTELACDVCAMRLIGPAFVIGFAEVTAANRTVEGGEKAYDHPPPALRFEVLEDEVVRFEHEGRIRGLTKTLQPYLRSHEGTPTQPSPSSPARRWLSDALDRFRVQLDDLLVSSRAKYEPAVLARDLPVVRRAIAAGIPPSERITAFDRDAPASQWSREIDWRSILNGVLLDFLEKHGAPTATNDVRSARRQAIALARAAIELSEFQRRARSLRAQVDDLRLPATP